MGDGDGKVEHGSTSPGGGGGGGDRSRQIWVMDFLCERSVASTRRHDGFVCHMSKQALDAG